MPPAPADPHQIIAESPMAWRQWLAVAVTILLNAIDGFDILSSAFAGPGIKQEWNLGADGLGLVLAMELVGMGIGSLALGGMADRFGRRPTILVCLLLMASGMFLAAGAASPQALSLWRIVTGMGIGGMLAAINAVAFEFSSSKARPLALSLMVIGYPIGAFLGGKVAAELLQSHDWRAIFLFGGAMTALCLPLVLLCVPETPAWLAQARPPDALRRINAILVRFGHAPVAALAEHRNTAHEAGLGDIFRPPYRRATLILSLGFAAHGLTFYFLLKMTPVILSDPSFAGQSYSRSAGASALAYANLGGALGGASFGWLMHRLGNKRATLTALAATVLATLHFGLGHASLPGWIWAIVITQFAGNAAIVGFYAAFAACFPTHIKATGTGFALSIGRAGAALSPALAGLLFADGAHLLSVAAVMASGSLFALVLFALLPRQSSEPR